MQHRGVVVAEPARAHPVQRRSGLDETGSWTGAQALDLLAQGYSVARVVQVTGFDHRWVRFQAARMPHVDDGADVDGGSVGGERLPRRRCRG